MRLIWVLESMAYEMSFLCEQKLEKWDDGSIEEELTIMINLENALPNPKFA